MGATRFLFSAVLAVALSGPLAVRAATPVKLLVSIGSNVGDPSDTPLRFADEDARRVESLFERIGQVSSDRAYLLLDPSVEKVRERMAEVTGRIAELARAGKDVELLIYVSSHANAGVLHLRGTHLSLEALRKMAEDTQARVRVLIVDACDAGQAVRDKGGTLGPGYRVSIQKLPLRGTVVLSSSGPSEPSQEWASLEGSLFTHNLLTGLRGDADADDNGSVTLSEAYAYAYRRTVRDAVARAQHPAFDVELSGTGELVLSNPIAAKSAVVFPAGLEGHYVLASQPRPDVVAEVDKHKGRAVRLAVPPGHYVLRKRMSDTTGVMTLFLPYGGNVTVDESRMVLRSFAEVALKGGYVELRPWAVELLGDVGTRPFPSSWGRWRTGLALRRTEGRFWARVGLTFGMMGYRGQAMSIDEDSSELELSAGFRWLLTPVIPYVGLSVGLEGFEQRFTRDDEARIQALLGTGPIPSATTLGVSVGPVVGLEIPVTSRVFGWVSLTGQARMLPVANRSAWSVGAKGEVGFGWIF